MVPLHFAARSDEESYYVGIIQLLLDNGANPNGQSDDSTVHPFTVFFLLVGKTKIGSLARSRTLHLHVSNTCCYGNIV